MATKQAHGQEIGQVDYLTHSIAIMSDGVVLKNYGQGWKRYATVKADVTPLQALENRKATQADYLNSHPAFRAYRTALHDIAGLSKRWKIHTAIEMMPNDPDGVWSEACDGYGDNVHASIDEVCNLCRLYKAAESETKATKE